MDTLTFDPCLLISGKNNANFTLIGMQTNDTIGLTDKTFSDREETTLKEATFTAKPKQFLTTDQPMTFNGGVLFLSTNGEITLRQKGQGKRLKPVDAASPQAHQQYQIKNLKRGLRFLPLNLKTIKLFVFVDRSFANNADLTSQLSFIVILANKESNNHTTTGQTPNNTGMFTVTRNIIHFSSTKCKRVTRSVLASEIYAMVAGADIAHAIRTTLALITKRLAIPLIPMVICTDSYSLYECLVKLSTTKEKQLMIDIMALRQSDNPADSFTKSSPNSALEALVSDGKVKIRMNGWVSRT
ncbi:hypothetical protein LX36DRAFT_665047 [Colletotrichum falcatum]|nr:hypothetical protein LX36DRAFT_665047 [Colletotrichum falcatum]